MGCAVQKPHLDELGKLNSKGHSNFLECVRDFKAVDRDTIKLPNKPTRLVNADGLLPYMVFVVFVSLLEMPYIGKGEKIAWTIPVQFHNELFLLSHRKLGFEIATDCNQDAISDEFVRRLLNACEIGDHLLEPFVRSQVQSGHVLIPNQYHNHRNRYLFFRTQATSMFTSPPPKLGEIGEGHNWDPYLPTRQGFYYAQAMLDAYFNYLEHVMVLLLVFEQLPTDLSNFISANWTAKFKTIFKLKSNPAMMRQYDALRKIKERFRNTFSHGGFERDEQSLFFSVPGFGYVPLTLSRFENSVHFSLFPIDNSSYQNVCNIIDAFESEVDRDALMKRKFEVIKAGLDIRWADKNGYEAAVQSDEELLEFIEHESYIWATNANMDW